MAASRTANSDSFSVSTLSDREIRLTRLFDAPRHLIFEVMTKPEHVREWWGRLGDGYSVPVCEIDLRVGGRWHFVNRHPKGEVAFHGVYHEIAAPERLVYTELMEPHPDESVVTVVLEERAGKTHMSVTARYSSPEVCDIVLKSGMEHGAALSYDRLEEVAAGLAAGMR